MSFLDFAVETNTIKKIWLCAESREFSTLSTVYEYILLNLSLNLK